MANRNEYPECCNGACKDIPMKPYDCSCDGDRCEKCELSTEEVLWLRKKIRKETTTENPSYIIPFLMFMLMCVSWLV